MASEKFEIESYKVRVIQSPGASRRIITFTSTPLYHGIRVRALINFHSFPKGKSFEHMGGVGVVDNIEAPNTDDSNLTAFCQPEAFDAFYHVLNAEKPVYLTFTYQDLPDAQPDDTTKLVTDIELSTDEELPGDADKDPYTFWNLPFSIAIK